MKLIIIENIVYTKECKHLNLKQGWGCGYVALPKTSVFFKKSIRELNSINANITFADSSNKGIFPLEFTKEHWIVGFHTGGLFSSPEKHNMEFVAKETRLLAQQLATTDSEKDLLRKINIILISNNL